MFNGNIIAFTNRVDSYQIFIGFVFFIYSIKINFYTWNLNLMIILHLSDLLDTRTILLI